MNIYSIKTKSSKNVNIFIVETSIGEYLLHSDVIVKEKIAVGEYDNQHFFQAVEESDQIIAFNLTAKYISSTMKTEKQIKDYLYKKEYKTKTILAVVEKLKTYGLIDDKMFADNYVKNNSNFSANKLKQKLLMFGIDKELASLAVQEVNDENSCKKSASKFMKNKQATTKTKEKLIRHLLGKGFVWADVSSALLDYNFVDEQVDF